MCVYVIPFMLLLESLVKCILHGDWLQEEAIQIKADMTESEIGIYTLSFKNLP